MRMARQSGRVRRFAGRSAVMALVGIVVLSSAARGDAGLLDDETRRRMEAAGVVSAEVVGALDVEGMVRVVVAFALPDAVKSLQAEGFDKAAWDAAIEAVGGELLAGLDPGDFTLTARYRSARGFAGGISAAGVVRLLGDRRVVRVDRDEPTQANLAEAVPFVRMNATRALGFTGAGVTVAVLDTGIDATHPDLADALAGEQCFCESESGPCCPNGSSQQGGSGSAIDDEGHGSWVSGIITGNGVVAPRGGAPGARILAVKVLDSGGNGLASSAVAALDWVLNNRPDVRLVNMSFGGSNSPYNADCDEASAITRMYADAITALRVAGTTPIVASGNGGVEYYMSAPACVRDAVSVGASYDDDPAVAGYGKCFFPEPQADAVACFTSSNSRTDLFAPGVLLTSVRRGGGFETESGTSGAAPLATACAAALLEAAPQLWSSWDLERALESGPLIHDDRTDRSFPPDGFSFPRLDCMEALSQVLAYRGLCPGTPRLGCRRPVQSGAARLYVKTRDSGNSRYDALRWDWKRGAATSIADWGDPASRTSYSVCVYEENPPRMLMNLFAPAGGTCSSKPCWSFSPSGYYGGWLYGDKLLSPSGIKSMQLRDGAEGSAKIRVKGLGPNLEAPLPPFRTPVRVQLINHENNFCWEATYSSATTNAAYGWGGKFSARSD